MKLNWRWLFAISAAAVLIGILSGLHILYLAAKPFLMITLALYFLSASKRYPVWRMYVVIALIFSWAGDILLIKSDLFIFALLSFLLAHIFYIIAYHNTGAAQGKIKALDIIKFVLFGSVLIWVIYPGLGDMLIPVLVYALVLLGMGIWAHKRRSATNDTSFLLVAAGASLFVIADGLIAVNRFAFEIPAERLVVMTLYITAQYLIVEGLLNHEEHIRA
jgi:uncharacterized membrane protein YhhN